MNLLNTHTDWIAVELGKSGLQAWKMQGNRALSHAQDSGQTSLTETALRRLIDPWLSAPILVLICGQTGRQGQPVPASATNLTPVPQPFKDPRLRAFTLPCLTQSRPPDIMTSDATRITGFLALNSGWDGVICQPGAQTSWALVSAGEVVSFQTFLSVELAQMFIQRFALINSGTNSDADTTDWNNGAFITALDETLSRPERLATALNALRIGVPVQSLPSDVARARLWGALIGAELAAAKPYWLGQQIAVIGPPDLARPYCEALQHQGAPVLGAEDQQMTLAGLIVARGQLAAQGG